VTATLRRINGNDSFGPRFFRDAVRYHARGGSGAVIEGRGISCCSFPFVDQRCGA